jgi:hypothetical protein
MRNSWKIIIFHLKLKEENENDMVAHGIHCTKKSTWLGILRETTR